MKKLLVASLTVSILCCEVSQVLAGVMKPRHAKQSLHTHQISADSVYLFVYFTGNGTDAESIRFALSPDGYHYTALNNNQPVINSVTISSTGGVRDPHILRGRDGHSFYMVATDMNVAKNGWNIPDSAIVLLKSNDLINWRSSVVNIPKSFSAFAGINRAWAPQTIYDEKAKKYMVYWSMRFGNEPDKIYYAYSNSDFSALETTPKQLFFKPDNGACIDADIVRWNGKYHLFFKTEGGSPGIMKAVSNNLTDGYNLINKKLDPTDDAVEGADVFRLLNSNTWILMYDVYMKGRYQFCKSIDLENFSVIDNQISMDFHPRHGTIIHISKHEAEKLLQKWPSDKK